MRDHSGFGWHSSSASCSCCSALRTFIWPEAALESFVMVYGVLAATGIMDLCARGAPYGLRPDDACQWYFERDGGFMLLVYPLPGSGPTLLFLLVPDALHLQPDALELGFTAGRVNYTISLVLNILGIMLATLMLLHPDAVGRFHEPDDRLLSHPAGRGRHRAGAQQHGTLKTSE